MKLLFIIGDAAVGKMTVGQELMKITDLRLFHNHMTIEPVIEIFGRYEGKTIAEIRDVIFKNYAASDNDGMIFTMMMDFNLPSEWAYLEHVKGIFEPYGTDFYYVELIAQRSLQHVSHCVGQERSGVLHLQVAVIEPNGLFYELTLAAAVSQWRVYFYHFLCFRRKPESVLFLLEFLP